MAIEQIGTLIRVAVPAEDQVHAVGLEDRQEVLAHFDQLKFGVGIMRSLRVRRMVPVGDDPLLGSGLQVQLQPHRHVAGWGTVGGHRIEAYEVDVGVIERVIVLRLRRLSARLAGRGQREHREIEVGVGVDRGLGRVVVAQCRPGN